MEKNAQLKILQINSVCGIGSTGRIATEIYKILKQDRIDCMIAYGRENAATNIKSIKVGSKISNFLHLISTRIFDKHGFGSKVATHRLIRKIKQYQPDIIHLHNIHGYYLNIKILFKFLKTYDKPVVWTLHDCWAITGHCAHFDYVKCDKWLTGCYKCPEKKNYPKSLIFDNSKLNYRNKKRLFTSLFDLTIIATSDWLKTKIDQSYLNKYNIEVIKNGIDLNVFKPTPSGFRQKYHLEEKFVLLGVANPWTERKGFDYFIELSKILDDSFQIVMVGLNKKQLNELPNNIIGISKTNNVQELVEIYSSCDLFINPTLEDTYPTTNLEALACGIPVITFKTGGSVESINDDCGMIIEQGNIGKLTDAIYQLQQFNFLKENCLKQAENFDKNKAFKKYLDLYMRVIK